MNAFGYKENIMFSFDSDLPIRWVKSLVEQQEEHAAATTYPLVCVVLFNRVDYFEITLFDTPINSSVLTL